MKLERLNIIQLPGILKGFVLENLAPGINLITGPNASGKSSLVRAMRYLIDPSCGTREGTQGAVTLEADLSSSAGSFRVIRSGRQIEWHQDGKPVDRPLLPEGNFIYCYWLSMHDLLEEGATEHEILKNIQRTLAGGFDLEEVRRETLPELGPRYGRSQAAALEERERGLRKIIQHYESLEAERGRLEGLDREIYQANLASTRVAKVDQALELMAAKGTLREAENEVEDFPAGIERLQGQEKTRLEELEKRRKKIVQQRTEVKNRLADARLKQQKTELGEQSPGAAEVAARQKDIEEVERCRVQLEENRNQLRKAQAKEKTAAEKLTHPSAEIPRISPEKAQKAMECAEKLWEHKQKLTKLKLSAETEPVSENKLEAVGSLISELRRWLRQVEPATLRSLFVGGGLAMVLALAAMLSAWAGKAPAAFVFSTAAGLGMAYVMVRLNLIRTRRRECERRVAEINPDPPLVWNMEKVGGRLEALENELAQLRCKQERAAYAERDRREIEELDKELAKLDKEKNELAEEIGFDPAKGFENLAQFHRLVSELDQAGTERLIQEQAVDKKNQEIRERLDKVADLLYRNNLRIEQDEPDINTVKSYFDELRERIGILRDAKREAADAEKEIDRLNGETKEVDQALAELYEKAGLPAGEREALVKLCEKFDDYVKACKKKEQAENLVKHKQNGLEQEPELLKYVENDNEVDLITLRDKLKNEAGRLNELYADRADLKQRLDKAGGDQALEKARFERDQAYEALRDAYEKTMYTAAGQFLLEQVTDEHRTKQEPEIVAKARERMEYYTDNRYSLQLDREGAIQTYDLEQEIVQGPEELSGGTRMQLFMALRFAATSMLEKNIEPLPVFLDEVLTAADPQRFGNIVRNLKSVAEKEGRQIICLSTQTADVIRWEKAAGERPRHIHLPWTRSEESAGEPEDYPVSMPEPVPAPGSLSDAEYAAKLRVPPLDPGAGAGAIHIFHLLRDDLQLLYQLLNDQRITHLGPLEKFLASEAAVYAIPDKETRQRISSRCRVARVWLDLWCQGRGRPVDRHLLEQSDAVSDSFIDQVSELAQRVNGDAEQLLEHLAQGKVPRFRQNKIEELKEWLEEQGCIENAEILNQEERLRQTLSLAAGYADPQEIQTTVSFLEGPENSG